MCFWKINGGTMVVYDLNDAKYASSMYFETKEKAVIAGAGICYERYNGESTFQGFINCLNEAMKYEDITIEPIVIY